MKSETPVIVEARDLTLAYGKVAILRDAALTIRQGEWWFFLGPNGVGKTTLLKALSGVLAPLSGRLERHPEHMRGDRMGFVPQRVDLNPSLPTTVRELVSLGLAGLRLGAAERRARLAGALARMGLGGLEMRSYWALSGGQRQRALVARALVREPRVLVIDEPASGLDLPAERDLFTTLARLHGEEGLTILCVTHDLRPAARFATHAALFVRGTLHAGRIDEILKPEPLQDAYGVPLKVEKRDGHVIVDFGDRE